jgi:tRNA nucleotidyltransferase (CCA-adding enzyme)
VRPPASVVAFLYSVGRVIESLATKRLSPPAPVRRIAGRLEAAGFETWCVGGAVRDALLGLEHLDWDLATAATPPDIQRLFRRTVPVGIEHGTVGVMDEDGRLHEVTTFRADVETDGRHAVVRFGVSLEEDLARRDFTINAIAYSPSRDELRDPFGGQADLAAGQVRAVGTAAIRMAEDRLRALRAMRFASRFGFRVDPATWAAIVESAPHLMRLSMERVRQEWIKTLEQVAAPSASFAMWRASAALATLVPALAAVDEMFFRAMDTVPLPSATRRTERGELRRLTRFALPFLPIGDVAARAAVRGLKGSNREVDFTAAMSRAWTMPGGLNAGPARARDRGVARRLASAIGALDALPALRCAAAVWHSEHGSHHARDRWACFRNVARSAWREPISVADLAVDGEDLQRAGVPKGPALGGTLRALLDWVLDDPTRNVRERLLERVAAGAT